MTPQARNNPVIFSYGADLLSLCIQCQFCNEQQAQAGRTTLCGGPEMLYLLHFSHLRKKYDKLRRNGPTFLLANTSAFNHTTRASNFD